MNRFKIGIIVDFIMDNLEDGIKKAHQLGADGIQFHAVSGETAPENMSVSRRKVLLAMLKDYGMTVSAVCGDLGGHGFERKADHAKKIDASKRIMELAYDFECSIVTTHIGTVRETGELRDNMLQACKTLGDFAQSASAAFAIETGPETCSQLKQFLDETGTKGMCVNFDPANLVMVTDDDPVDGVHILKDYIVHTHAKDGVMLKKTDPLTIYNYFAEGGIEDLNLQQYFREESLGKGDVDFSRYLGALWDIGYDGFLTIERELGTDPMKDITESMAFLRGMIHDKPWLK